MLSLVNCKGSGDGEIEAKVSCKDIDIPFDILKPQADTFDLIFTPLSAGDYDIHVEFCGIVIRGMLFNK